MLLYRLYIDLEKEKRIAMSDKKGNFDGGKRPLT